MPGREPVRVTTDAKVFDFSGDSHQLFSPGGDVFERFGVDNPPSTDDSCGIAWLIRRENGTARPLTEYVVATRFGLHRVQTLTELLNALESVASPVNFPFEQWPGVTVSVIA